MAKGWAGSDRTGKPFPSLGWALLDRWYDLFPSPRDESKPFVLTDAQALAVLRWYEIHPVTGAFVYRRGCTRKAKKTGKSPIEAAKCIAELAMEVRFDGWDANGEPVGRPWGTGGDAAPWVQIASLSEDQDENTYAPLFFFLTANDGRLADALGIDAGQTRCLLQRNKSARIEPVTASAGSREGQPVTYAALDETGLMLPGNGGVKLAKTIRRNCTGMNGRTYETTNGYMPGEGSVAEGTEKAATARPGIFYDCLEAPTEVDGHEVDERAPDWVLRKALETPYNGCWWNDLDRIVADIRDTDMPWSDAQRFFFNWNRKGEGKAVDPGRWAELARPDRVVVAGERIGLGFDGSISRDATALIGCTAGGHSFAVKVWERPLGVRDWRVPRLEVHAEVERAFETWDVGLMLCDPPKWTTEIEEWAQKYGDDVVLMLDTNQEARFSKATDRWLTANREGTHTHAGDEVLTRHVEAAHLKKVRVKADENDGRTMYVIVKGDDARKIDACVADVLAYQAARTMPAASPKRKPMAVWV